VDRVFGGLLRSDVTCCACGYTSTAYDPFLDISLDMRCAALRHWGHEAHLCPAGLRNRGYGNGQSTLRWPRHRNRRRGSACGLELLRALDGIRQHAALLILPQQSMSLALHIKSTACGIEGHQFGSQGSAAGAPAARRPAAQPLHAGGRQGTMCQDYAHSVRGTSLHCETSCERNTSRLFLSELVSRSYQLQSSDVSFRILYFDKTMCAMLC